ncbi:hypothetical protein FACS189430_07890 [Bacteroidia bacterium]|nr:hypothetical protein FACS189430_07890 [Bacteroidia bacterium]
MDTDFIYHRSRIPQNYGEQKEFFKELEQKWLEEITNSDKAKQWLDKKDASSVASFIQGYVRKKISIVQQYDFFERKYQEKETNELVYIKYAKKTLEAIQQKKLFNAQLLWRANQLKIDGIDISWEFKEWENHVFECPFIKPVQNHEIELMKEYLTNSYADDCYDVLVDYVPWQDYDEMTEKNEEGDMDNMNEWYEFYDGRMGTGTLLILPNLKGQKEEFYLSLCRNRSTTDTEPAPVAEVKHHLMAFGQDIVDFAAMYETDKYMVKLFKGYEVDWRENDKTPEPENIRYAVEVLLSADRSIHLSGHLNWDEGIMYATKKYKGTKTAEALDMVYEDYKMRLELGFSNQPEQKYKFDMSDIISGIKKQILKGRMRNGESEDFDY